MTLEPIGLAQLGCGYWGPNLLRNFSSQPGCVVKWVVEQDARRRTYVESNYPASATTDDVATVLEDPQIQGVVVATPAATHFPLARAALEAGKHVFVEKPVATTTEQADELRALAERAGRVLMVGHTFLYNPAVRHMKALLDRGELGSPYYLYAQRLNLGQVRSDVNAWWNLAPHDVSILVYLMDGRLPVEVRASGASFIQPGIEDVVFAVLTWEDGVAAHIHVSWLDPSKVRRVVLVGSKKMVVYDDVSDDKLAVFDKGVDRLQPAGGMHGYDQPGQFRLLHRAGDVWLPRVDFQEPLRIETAHFLECIRTGATPLTGPAHARDVVAVLEAGSQSLAGGGAPVRIG